MMTKPILILLTFLFFMNTISAQQDLKDPRYKKLVGRYGSSSGICLFQDGTYLLYGYATAVFGVYKFDKDQMLFSADQQEMFEVFANYNPSLNKKTRINFVGFERGNRTFVNFENTFIPVFNSDANCFGAPFVYLKPEQVRQFNLATDFSNNSKTAKVGESWSYLNEDGYNDFVFVHNETKREYEDFTAVVVENKDETIIKLSNYGGDQGYARRNDTTEDSQWKEILQMKQQLAKDRNEIRDFVYANQHYRPFAAPLSANYKFDKAKNVYVANNAKENEGNYKQDQYNDPSYIRKYKRLKVASKKEFRSVADAKTKSIFFTVCGEGSENSYHYDDFIEYKIPHQEIPMVKPLNIKNK